MDDRDRPDTKVVRLRRQGDPDEARREQLARTIFAREDESGTFSLGNLIPPEPKQDNGDDVPEDKPDTFFDRVRRERQAQANATVDPAAPGDGTAAYFDQFSARSAAEMAASAKPSTPVTTLPGSAQLPRELPRPRRRRHRNVDERRPRGRTTSTRTRALVRRGLAGTVLTAGAIAVIVVGTSGSGNRHPSRAAAALSPALANEVDNAIRITTNVSAGVAQTHVTHAINHHWRLAAMRKVVSTARQTKRRLEHTSTSTGPSTTTSTSTATSAGGQASTGTGSSYTEPVASTAAGSTQQGSNSGARPAFGATGVLGPGSSPNG